MYWQVWIALTIKYKAIISVRFSSCRGVRLRFIFFVAILMQQDNLRHQNAEYCIVKLSQLMGIYPSSDQPERSFNRIRNSEENFLSY